MHGTRIGTRTDRELLGAPEANFPFRFLILSEHPVPVFRFHFRRNQKCTPKIGKNNEKIEKYYFLKFSHKLNVHF